MRVAGRVIAASRIPLAVVLQRCVGQQIELGPSVGIEDHKFAVECRPPLEHPDCFGNFGERLRHVPPLA